MSVRDVRMEDWRDRKGMKGCLEYCLDNEHLMDIQFRFVEETPLQTARAHRLILAVRSPVFEAMFYGPLADGADHVDITDIDSSAFRAMLRYIYTDDVDLLRKDVLGIIKASHKYCVPGLTDKCSEYLVNTVTMYNACELLENATLFGVECLQYQCLAIIDCYAREVIKSDGFLSLSRSNVERILRGNSLQADEAAIYQAVVAWTEAECHRLSLDPTDFQVRRKVADPLVKLIRFPIIPQKTFSQEVVGSPLGLLSTEETIKLFQMFTSRNTVSEEFNSTPRNDRSHIEILRFEEDGHCRFWYQGLEDKFEFSCDQKLVFTGVSFKGSIQRCGCSGNLEGWLQIYDISSDEALLVYDKAVKHHQRPPSDKPGPKAAKESIYDVIIDFDKPIFISPGMKFEVLLKINSSYNECECNEICDCYDLLSNKKPLEKFQYRDIITTFEGKGEAIIKGLSFHRWR
ncbi:BTB/POZ domain-containing protein 6-like isoform X2 [Liolophura sinensis]